MVDFRAIFAIEGPAVRGTGDYVMKYGVPPLRDVDGSFAKETLFAAIALLLELGCPAEQ